MDLGAGVGQDKMGGGERDVSVGGLLVGIFRLNSDETEKTAAARRKV